MSQNSSIGSDSLRDGWSGNLIPVKARFFAPAQTGRGAHPASYKIGTGSLSRWYSGRGVALTTHSHLRPRLKKEYFMVCSRVKFDGTFSISVNFLQQRNKYRGLQKLHKERFLSYLASKHVVTMDDLSIVSVLLAIRPQAGVMTFI